MRNVLVVLMLFSLAFVTNAQQKKPAANKPPRIRTALLPSGSPEADLSWNAPTSGCTGTQTCTYNIYRGLTSGGETLLTTGIGTTTFADTSITRGTTYFWQVSASNGVGEGGKSNEATGTIPNVPGAPTGLAVTTK